MEPRAGHKPRINSLQAGRALAAFGVLVNHVNLSVSARVGAFPEEIAAILKVGAFRVDFFFVLSGFIIYLTTHGKGLSGVSSAYAFLRKRAVRIYPLYWIMTLMLIIRFAFDPSYDWVDTAWHWFPSLTLLPYSERTAITAAWTLQFEILFYLIFALGILLNRLRLVLIIWASMLLVLLFTGITIPALHHSITSYVNLEFCIGIAAAYLFVKHPTPPWLCVMAAILCLIGFHLTDHRLFIGLLFAPTILLLTQMERAQRFTVPRWINFLGDSSYSLCLSHSIIINLLSRAMALVTDNAYVGLIATCAGCYAFAIIIYIAVEKPLIRWTTAKN